MYFVKFVRIILNIFDYFQQKKIIKLLKGKFKSFPVIIDVGAHHGETIKLFDNNFKMEKIYSFEASPTNFEVLKKQISEREFNKKYEIYNFGIGEKQTNGFINQTKESSSSTINEINLNSKYLKRKLRVLNIRENEVFYKKVPIKIITLDEFINKNKINNIDLLKIDTEGYELNVLKGLTENHKLIKLIYFEHHYDDMIKKKYKFGDIHNLLINYNFKNIYKIKMVFRKSFEYIYENQNI